MALKLKPLDWIASSKKDLLGFPKAVCREIGIALTVAQYGGRHFSVKTWKGSGSGVFEVVERHDRNAYRAVYTVRLQDFIYVLHCFQKKSVKGKKTPQPDIDLVNTRLKTAQEHHVAQKKGRKP